jgi:hypothetical protein
MGGLRLLLSFLLTACVMVRAQNTKVVSSEQAPSPESAESKPGSLAMPSTNDESFANRFWLSIQGNFIRQQHPSFTAKYSGPNSLRSDAEHATSLIETLYSGFAITRHLEILFDVESAGGGGISDALGVAGFTNVDVVRNPTLGEAPYISRVMLHYTIPLSKDLIDVTRNPLSLASKAAARRLELRLGKMGTADFFDLNSVGSDSHLQFMNWALVNNGSYDYAADTRGYTYGLVAEYYDGNWAARFGELLMPTVANGTTLDWNIWRAGGHNLEVEYHSAILLKRQTVVRALTYLNRANMGSYRVTNNEFSSGTSSGNSDSAPDITLSRRQGRKKYGFGLNGEQELTQDWRAFGRLGWSDGRNEAFAYTEIDRTAAFGSDLRGTRWHRPQDQLGGAFVVNGLSGDHRRYLALGGLGFILGDGALNYGTERIFETYYTCHIWRGISFAADFQHVTNPGYNQDRGPANVTSFRLHVEEGVPFDKLGFRR